MHHGILQFQLSSRLHCSITKPGNCLFLRLLGLSSLENNPPYRSNPILLRLPVQVTDSGTSCPGHLTRLFFSSDSRSRSSGGSTCISCRECTVQAHRHLEWFHAPVQPWKLGVHAGFLGDAEATHELQALGKAGRVYIQDGCRAWCEAWCEVCTHTHCSRVCLRQFPTMHLVKLSWGGKIQTVRVHLVQVGQRRGFYIAFGSWPTREQSRVRKDTGAAQRDRCLNSCNYNTLVLLWST